ncbi:uncharacterized protein ACBR49_010684 [Aulostomus maculatus]
MCIETMDNTSSKHIISSCIRNPTTPASEVRWTPLPAFTQRDEAFRQGRGGSMKAPGHLQHNQRWAQTPYPNHHNSQAGKKRNQKEKQLKHKSSRARTNHRLPGEMAPENTTQFLMSNVYEDVFDVSESNVLAVPPHGASSKTYGESSPGSVYAALDTDYEICLAFQQRDFDELFGLCW